jgi:putative flippase GtrA
VNGLLTYSTYLTHLTAATEFSLLLPVFNQKLPLKQLIISVLDYFYVPVQKWIDRQTFRYIACGGGNTLLDIVIYFVTYNFILKKQVVHTPVIAVSPYIAAFIISFLITFPTGFLLMRNIVFPGSDLRGRVQLLRYFMLVMVCVVLNYVFIKLFVEQFGMYPTIAKVVTTALVISFSYLTQRHFTFKTAKRNNT